MIIKSLYDSQPIGYRYRSFNARIVRLSMFVFLIDFRLVALVLEPKTNLAVAESELCGQSQTILFLGVVILLEFLFQCLQLGVRLLLSLGTVSFKTISLMQRHAARRELLRAGVGAAINHLASAHRTDSIGSAVFVINRQRVREQRQLVQVFPH